MKIAKFALEMLGVICFCAIGLVVIYFVDKATSIPTLHVSSEFLDDDQEFTLKDEWRLVRSGYSKDGDKLSYEEFMELVENGVRCRPIPVSPQAPSDWR